MVRTFKADDRRVEYPVMSLDRLNIDVLKRLGIHAVRSGLSYYPTTADGFADWYAKESATLRALKDANITVLTVIFPGPAPEPLGMPRPWLTDDGVMMDNKTDMAWLPASDPDFEIFCRKVAGDFGWPKGPITAFSLMNEPWDGTSISGWGADIPRYREMYMSMAHGVDNARRFDGVNVLIGGTDSTSNALDKLFSDGTNTMLPWFDFLSIHYQGLSSSANVKQWLNRKSPRGRVRIWDTESWVANTDDRVAAEIAGERAAGCDRTMGVYGGNVATENVYSVTGDNGKDVSVTNVDAWPVAAAVGAASHFIGDRNFNRLLFQNGLPWIMLFDGADAANGHINPEDGTVVVVGDLGDEFGANLLPLRTARGFAEIAHKAALRQELAKLPSAAAPTVRATLLKSIDTPETLSKASMTISAQRYFSVYDYWGNQVPAVGGKVVIPLDGRAFFLRGDGSSGSYGRLVDALRSAHIAGIEPLAIVAHDMTQSIDRQPIMRLTLTNVLNRQVKGSLSVRLGQLALTYPIVVKLEPGETRDIRVSVKNGIAVDSNTYPLAVRYNAGPDGVAVHDEDIHVNLIAHRTIKVDGDLSDWKGVLPQSVTAGSGTPTLTQAAWFPYEKFDTTVKSGFATAYIAYDSKNFYFAAKIADDTPDPGMVRTATRDDDQYIYPAVSYKLNADKAKPKTALNWPAGVRRFSYRENPDLPSGNFPPHDNVQIAFNVIPPDKKPWYPTAPGTMPGFINYWDTDYEYALNPIAEKYGGGVEIWRLAAPGMPHKHFYPREPKSPFDGAVKGQLVIKRVGNTRIVEAAIPWSEIPAVKNKLDQDQNIKFTFRVNDNGNPGIMELSNQRSVSRQGGCMHVDWVEHWTNELEFGWDK
jgi:hypothetical protein